MIYQRNDYKKKSMPEKIEFMRQIHSGELDFWGEDYDYSEAGDDFLLLQDELRDDPESISEEDMLLMMKIFNDRCFELSWQHCLTEILAGNLIHFGGERMKLYLANLNSVPESGRMHGWKFVVQMLLSDEGSICEFEKAALSQSSEIKTALSEIIQGINIDQDIKDRFLGELL